MEEVCFIVVVFLVLLEISNYLIYGRYISKKEQELFMNLNLEDIELIGLNSDIISWDFSMMFISKIDLLGINKYYINEVGQVPRWSKLHKKIDEYYLIGLKNKIRK